MNTVDSLKKLYKTMAGKDWPYDPNPTDAEVIDKIAADGKSGGGTGLPEIVFQVDFTDMIYPSEGSSEGPETENPHTGADASQTGAGADAVPMPKMSILTSKQEVVELAKHWSNCVVCVNVIGTELGKFSLFLQEGKNYGLICRLYYHLQASKIQGNPDEETLVACSYIAQPYSAGLELCAYDSQEGQRDVWDESSDYLPQVMGELLGGMFGPLD